MTIAAHPHNTRSVITDHHRWPLEIGEVPGKGRGVFASRPIPAGTLIEEAPVVVLSSTEVAHIRQTRLDHYIFHWDSDVPGSVPPVCAIVLGYASLLNHASVANTEFIPLRDASLLQLRALRQIAAGEELTIDYDIPLWFSPA